MPFLRRPRVTSLVKMKRCKEIKKRFTGHLGSPLNDSERHPVASGSHMVTLYCLASTVLEGDKAQTTAGVRGASHYAGEHLDNIWIPLLK